MSPCRPKVASRYPVSEEKCLVNEILKWVALYALADKYDVAALREKVTRTLRKVDTTLLKHRDLACVVQATFNVTTRIDDILRVTVTCLVGPRYFTCKKLRGLIASEVSGEALHEIKDILIEWVSCNSTPAYSSTNFVVRGQVKLESE